MTTVQPITNGARARVARVLDAAAAQIDRHGLFAGAYWPGAADDHPHVLGDPCCAVGAIAVAAGITDPGDAAVLDRHPLYGQAIEALAEVVNGAPTDAWELVVTWNDAAERTEAEVAAALRAAATRIRSADPTGSARLAGGPSATLTRHARPGSSTHQHNTSQEVPTHG